MTCAPHCLNTRDSHFVHSYRLLMLSKDMFSKWRVTARQHNVIDVNQAQSMNDTVFISQSPQTGFHDRFLIFHVSKISRNTVVPCSWSIDNTVHGLQQSNTLMMLHLQLSRNSGNGSQNVSETGCTYSILKLSSSSSSSTRGSSKSP